MSSEIPFRRRSPHASPARQHMQTLEDLYLSGDMVYPGHSRVPPSHQPFPLGMSTEDKRPKSPSNYWTEKDRRQTLEACRDKFLQGSDAGSLDSTSDGRGFDNASQIKRRTSPSSSHIGTRNGSRTVSRATSPNEVLRVGEARSDVEINSESSGALRDMDYNQWGPPQSSPPPVSLSAAARHRNGNGSSFLHREQDNVQRGPQHPAWDSEKRVKHRISPVQIHRDVDRPRPQTSKVGVPAADNNFQEPPFGLTVMKPSASKDIKEGSARPGPDLDGQMLAKTLDAAWEDHRDRPYFSGVVPEAVISELRRELHVLRQEMFQNQNFAPQHGPAFDGEAIAALWKEISSMRSLLEERGSSGVKGAREQLVSNHDHERQQQDLANVREDLRSLKMHIKDELSHGAESVNMNVAHAVSGLWREICAVRDSCEALRVTGGEASVPGASSEEHERQQREMSRIREDFRRVAEELNQSVDHVNAKLARSESSLKGELMAIKQKFDEMHTKQISNLVEAAMDVERSSLRHQHEQQQRDVAKVREEFKALSGQLIQNLSSDVAQVNSGVKQTMSSLMGELVSVRESVEELQQRGVSELVEAALQCERNAFQGEREIRRLDLAQVREDFKTFSARVTQEMSNVQENMSSLQKGGLSTTGGRENGLEEHVAEAARLRDEFDGLRVQVAGEFQQNVEQVNKVIQQTMASLLEEIGRIKDEVDDLRNKEPSYDEKVKQSFQFDQLRCEISDLRGQAERMVQQAVDPLASETSALRRSLDDFQRHYVPETVEAAVATSSGAFREELERQQANIAQVHKELSKNTQQVYAAVDHAVSTLSKEIGSMRDSLDQVRSGSCNDREREAQRVGQLRENFDDLQHYVTQQLGQHKAADSIERDVPALLEDVKILKHSVAQLQHARSANSMGKEQEGQNKAIETVLDELRALLARLGQLESMQRDADDAAERTAARVEWLASCVSNGSQDPQHSGATETSVSPEMEVKLLEVSKAVEMEQSSRETEVAALRKQLFQTMAAINSMSEMVRNLTETVAVGQAENSTSTAVESSSLDLCQDLSKRLEEIEAATSGFGSGHDALLNRFATLEAELDKNGAAIGQMDEVLRLAQKLALGSDKLMSSQKATENRMQSRIQEMEQRLVAVERGKGIGAKEPSVENISLDVPSTKSPEVSLYSPSKTPTLPMRTPLEGEWKPPLSSGELKDRLERLIDKAGPNATTSCSSYGTGAGYAPSSQCSSGLPGQSTGSSFTAASPSAQQPVKPTVQRSGVASVSACSSMQTPLPLPGAAAFAGTGPGPGSGLGHGLAASASVLNSPPSAASQTRLPGPSWGTVPTKRRSAAAKEVVKPNDVDFHRHWSSDVMSGKGITGCSVQQPGDVTIPRFESDRTL